ncbi:unnamed protein product [Cochlearia groenlandica]
MAGKRKKLTPKRRNTKTRTNADEEDEHEVGYESEIERESREEDDCPAYAEPEGEVEVEDDVEVEGETEEGVVVEEETCQDLSVYFGDVAHGEDPISDADSGDDIWNDEKIPNSISSDEDEDKYEERERIPCIHDACVIMAKKQRVGDFASNYYLTTMFKKTYSRGHNKTTCSNPAATPAPKRPVGRPRIYEVGQPSEGASSQPQSQPQHASSQPQPASSQSQSQPQHASSQPAQGMSHGASHA